MSLCCDIQLGKRKSAVPKKLTARQQIQWALSFCSFTAKLRDSRKDVVNKTWPQILIKWHQKLISWHQFKPGTKN